MASVVSVTTPLKALPALARLIAPLVAVNDAMPATFRLVLAACVMLPALSMTRDVDAADAGVAERERDVVDEADVEGAGVGERDGAVEGVARVAQIDRAVDGVEARRAVDGDAVFVACAMLPSVAVMVRFRWRR